MTKSSLFLASALATMLSAGTVLAQSSNTTPSTNNATSPNATSSNSTNRSNASSSTTASNTSNVQFWTQDKGNEWRTSKIKGMNVYNENNDKLGSIDDILIDQSGQIKAVIIGVGGFLGLGEHNVAVPFNQLQFQHNNDNRNMTGANNNNTALGNNTTNTQARNDAGNPSTTATTNTGLGSPAAPGTVGNTAASTNAHPAMVNRNDNAPDRAILNATKDQLKNAPEFKYRS